MKGYGKDKGYQKGFGKNKGGDYGYKGGKSKGWGAYAMWEDPWSEWPAEQLPAGAVRPGGGRRGVLSGFILMISHVGIFINLPLFLRLIISHQD